MSIDYNELVVNVRADVGYPRRTTVERNQWFGYNQKPFLLGEHYIEITPSVATPTLSLDIRYYFELLLSTEKRFELEKNKESKLLLEFFQMLIMCHRHEMIHQFVADLTATIPERTRTAYLELPYSLTMQGIQVGWEGKYVDWDGGQGKGAGNNTSVATFSRSAVSEVLNSICLVVIGLLQLKDEETFKTVDRFVKLQHAKLKLSRKIVTLDKMWEFIG